jgi:peptidoglycan hydrolase CwlO-like protein
MNTNNDSDIRSIKESLSDIKTGITSINTTLNEIQRQIILLEANAGHQLQNHAALESRVKELESSLRAMEGRFAWFTGAVAVTATLLTQAVSWFFRSFGQ